MNIIRPFVGFICLVFLISIAPISVVDSKENASLKENATVKSDLIKVQNQNVKLIFDGEKIQPPQDQYIFIYNNTTYLPLRFISYSLKKNVIWDNVHNIVTIVEPSNSELASINQYLTSLSSKQESTYTSKTLLMNKIKVDYIFDNIRKTLPITQPTFIFNNTLYVPLRFLSESSGSSIKWDPKSKTITSNSTAHDKQSTSTPLNDEPVISATSEPKQTPEPSIKNSNGTKSDKVPYETITSETESKLNTLKSQSQSILMSIAFEYLAATDDASKASIKAKGLQQLDSFTASFNNIIASAEKELKDNGYSTDIINQYRSAFEAELQAGRNLAEGLAN